MYVSLICFHKEKLDVIQEPCLQQCIYLDVIYSIGSLYNLYIYTVLGSLHYYSIMYIGKFAELAS